jgi:hypothetical protein
MKLAEALREIAQECNTSEIEQALYLCTGFADSVTRESEEVVEYLEALGQSIATKTSSLPN